MSRVLITGGTGTLGHALVPKLLARGDTPIIFSRDEYKQSVMKGEFPDAEFILGDVREQVRVALAINVEADAVIHAAALKQINTGERCPGEFIRTNVMGSHHVAAAAATKGIPAVLVSSDKAVYPINVYGMTKALAEKLFLAMDLSVVRYGNILGSRGSLLEVIDRCVADGKPIPVTDPAMTRFWWTVDEAADFVIDNLGNPGLHIPALQSRSVMDIIRDRAPNHPTTVVGIGPGEKLHEWLETVEDNPGARSSQGGIPAIIRDLGKFWD